MVRLGEVNPPAYEAILAELESVLDETDLETEFEEFNWRKTANRRKFDRELFERYGYFKDIILHPKFQHVKHYLEEHADLNVFVGEPMLPATTAVIILFLMNKRVSNNILGLSALLIFNVNPIYVCLAALVVLILTSGKRKPKQFRALPKAQPTAKHVQNEASETGATPFPAAPAREQHPVETNYDHVLIGADLSTLYTAALLAKNGHRCCVLQPAVLGSQFEVPYLRKL